jgi:hypothetical protein
MAAYLGLQSNLIKGEGSKAVESADRYSSSD